MAVDLSEKDILIIEPFYGGSHQQLIKVLEADSEIGSRCLVCSLPAKKWQWRARTSALYFSQTIPFGQFRVLFASSVLNLAELVALRPDLAATKKIIYFHENQLVYPIRQQSDRDFQFGYNQILTCMVADKVVFNSTFNMESFLTSIASHLKLIPDHRPKNIQDRIRLRCQVLYFPLIFQDVGDELPDKKRKWDFKSHCDSNVTINNVSAPRSTDRSMDSTYVIKPQIEVSNLSHVASVSSALTAQKSLFEKSVVDKASLVSEPTKLDKKEELEATSQTISKSNTSFQHQNSNDRIGTYKFSSILDAVVPTDHSLQGCGQRLHIVWPHRWEHDKNPESFFEALLQLQTEGYSFSISVIGETFSEVPKIFHTARPLLEEKIIAWGYQTRDNYLKVLDSAQVVVSTALHEFFGVSMLEAVSRGCFPLCPKRLVYPEIYPDECLYSTQAQLVKHLKRFCQRPSTAKLNNREEIIQRFLWTSLRDSYRMLLLG